MKKLLELSRKNCTHCDECRSKPFITLCISFLLGKKVMRGYAVKFYWSTYLLSLAPPPSKATSLIRPVAWWEHTWDLCCIFGGVSHKFRPIHVFSTGCWKLLCKTHSFYFDVFYSQLIHNLHVLCHGHLNLPILVFTFFLNYSSNDLKYLCREKELFPLLSCFSSFRNDLGKDCKNWYMNYLD